MSVIYLLFVEDPWDEYYEEKFHSAFLTLGEAQTFVDSFSSIMEDGLRIGNWTIREVPLGVNQPEPGRRYPAYKSVSKKD